MSTEEAWAVALAARSRGGGAGAGSDLEALRAREDLRIMPLQRDARALLEDLPSLGPADYTTGNACAVCTRREAVSAVLPLGEGTTLFGAPDGVRWLDASWRHSVAVLSRGTDFTDTPPCLLFFGETGALAHQITLRDPATWGAFIELVQRHHGCWNCLRHPVDTSRPRVAADCPVWMLREAWLEAGSERDLEARLEGLGASRLLALRALEGLYATPVPLQDLASLLQELASSGLPVHIQLGNRHCTQALESPVEGLAFGPQAWEIRMAQATLRIDPARVESLWFTAQPRPEGERHRFECYGADGERVLALAVPQDPCPLVRSGWQRVVGRFEGRGLR